MVLSRWNVFGMEIHWLSPMDLWQAYVLASPFLGHMLMPIYIHF